MTTTKIPFLFLLFSFVFFINPAFSGYPERDISENLEDIKVGVKRSRNTDESQTPPKKKARSYGPYQTKSDKREMLTLGASCRNNSYDLIRYKLYVSSRQLGETQYELALIFLGKSANFQEPNDKKALEYFALSANNHHIKAQYFMGYLHEVGIGCEKDVEKAVEWYQRAAKKGCKKSMSRLVKFYKNGTGTLVDLERAAYYLGKLSDQPLKSLNNPYTFYLHTLGKSSVRLPFYSPPPSFPSDPGPQRLSLTGLKTYLQRCSSLLTRFKEDSLTSEEIKDFFERYDDETNQTESKVFRTPDQFFSQESQTETGLKRHAYIGGIVKDIIVKSLTSQDYLSKILPETTQKIYYAKTLSDYIRNCLGPHLGLLKCETLIKKPEKICQELVQKPVREMLDDFFRYLTPMRMAELFHESVHSTFCTTYRQSFCNHQGQIKQDKCPQQESQFHCVDQKRVQRFLVQEGFIIDACSYGEDASL